MTILSFLATWTPLLDATSFAGIHADLLTAVAGIIGLVLIILGLGLLVRALSR